MTLYEAESGNITMALTGDSLITRRTSGFKEPRYLGLVDRLRAADVSFTNAEAPFHNYESPPAAGVLWWYQRCDPRVIPDLQWMGINLVSCANNHSYDYGEGGILANIDNLDKAGLAHAGTGRNLAEARGPGYFDTNAGRVALVACTDSGPPESIAGEQRRDMIGRPGVSWLRSDAEYLVDEAALAALRKMSADIGFERHKQATGFEGDSETVFHWLGRPGLYTHYPTLRFALGEGGVRQIPNPIDLEEILQSVRDARRTADWVIVSMHHHETGWRREDPGEHTVTLARRAIDEGADVFVGHGAHRDQGIELYRGKPIFYTLGHLFMEHETVLRQPHDAYLQQGLGWNNTPADFFPRSPNFARMTPARPLPPEQEGPTPWSAQEGWAGTMAQVTFADRQLAEIRLVPVDLGFGRSRGTKGRPVLAEGDVAGRVLENLGELCSRYGTSLQMDGNEAIVKLS